MKMWVAERRGELYLGDDMIVAERRCEVSLGDDDTGCRKKT